MIIGLTGYAQSGKDEVAKILVEKYGFERRAFADNIRHMLYELNPMVNGEPLQIRIDVEGWDKAKQHPEVRRLLQVLGVSARNHLGEEVWINAFLYSLDMEKNYVISDVRFENEAIAIKHCSYQGVVKIPGEIWRIERPGVGPVNNHVSEKGVENISADRTLLNSGTLEDLEVLVKIRLDSCLANQTS